jgi:hypothetical protein
MDWNIAALFRFGNIDELFAQKLYDVPLPTNLSEDEQDAYREGLDEFARPIEDSAIGAYEYAIKEARRNVIMNEWTVRIQTSLNKYKAEEYPLFKSEVRPDAQLHTSNLFQFPVKPKELSKPEDSSEKKSVEPLAPTQADTATDQPEPSEPETNVTPDEETNEDTSSGNVPADEAAPSAPAGGTP